MGKLFSTLIFNYGGAEIIEIGQDTTKLHTNIDYPDYTTAKV